MLLNSSAGSSGFDNLRELFIINVPRLHSKREKDLKTFWKIVFDTLAKITKFTVPSVRRLAGDDL